MLNDVSRSSLGAFNRSPLGVRQTVATRFLVSAPAVYRGIVFTLTVTAQKKVSGSWVTDTAYTPSGSYTLTGVGSDGADVLDLDGVSPSSGWGSGVWQIYAPTSGAIIYGGTANPATFTITAQDVGRTGAATPTITPGTLAMDTDYTADAFVAQGSANPDSAVIFAALAAAQEAAWIAGVAASSGWYNGAFRVASTGSSPPTDGYSIAGAAQPWTVLQRLKGIKSITVTVDVYTPASTPLAGFSLKVKKFAPGVVTTSAVLIGSGYDSIFALTTDATGQTFALPPAALEGLPYGVASILGQWLDGPTPIAYTPAGWSTGRTASITGVALEF